MRLVKKSFLFVLICFLYSNAFAQTTVSVNWTEKTKLNAKDVIYFNANKKLTWANFLGTPPPPSSIAAVTSSGFGYNASMKSTNGVGTINISVYCYFSKPKSWVRVKNKTAYILEHEQHHFDASYLAAVSFMQKVKAANITTENMNEVIGKIYKEVSAAMNKMQDDYDNETNNGLKKDKQAEWNIFFNEKMKTLL
jgi:Bacterial protein of unknown function (DUF922)